MKLHIPKDWIKKFNPLDYDVGETIPVGTSKLCGCGNIIIVGCEFCKDCIDGYRGEDEI